MSQEKEEINNPELIEEERDIGGSEVNQQVEGIEVVIDPVREEPGVQETEEEENIEAEEIKVRSLSERNRVRN